MQKPTPPALEIENTTSNVLEVYVEVNPDRYLLRPGEKMTIEGDPNGVPFTLFPSDGAISVYAGNKLEPVVTIDGVRAKPDWKAAPDRLH